MDQSPPRTEHTLPPARPDPARSSATRCLVVLVLLLGVGVRTAGFGGIPPGLHQDEASTGYDAWALLQHGIDRNGYAYPVHGVAWGSGQNTLSAYLALPFIAVFGLSACSVRIVNLLAGIVSLLLCYDLARRVWDVPTALVATLALAITPWHVMLSRWGLESNLLPGCLLLATWLLVLAGERPRVLPVAFAAFAVSLYAYGSAYLVVPIALGLSALYLVRHRRIPAGVFLVATGVFVVLALPIALFVAINLLDLAEIRTAVLSVPRLPSRPRFTTTTALFSDMGLVPTATRVASALRFLVLQDDPRPFNAIPGIGLLYPFGLPFALVGLAVIFTRQLAWRRYTPVFFIVAWLAGSGALALAYERPNANRLNAALVPLILCAAVGIVAIVRALWERSPKLGAAAGAAVLVLYLTFFARFAAVYFTRYPAFAAPAFFDGLTQALHFAAERGPGPICVTDRGQMPYIFVLFATQPDPHRFLATVRYANPGGDFQRVVMFDRYSFGLGHCQDAGRAILVLEAAEVDGRPSFARRAIHAFGRYRVVLPEDPIAVRGRLGDGAPTGAA